MPRVARITLENACYHVITRGNQKQNVFLMDQDYYKYLRLLKKYKERYKFKLYAFCLMPNHVHLIMQVGATDKLKKIMHGLNLSYTQYFNYKHKKSGHLWQDRFKSKIIESEVYLLECVNYIENNPLRASLISDIKKYPWSSHNNHGFIDSLFSL